MFKNHWQLALRNLAKRKGYSALNIVGLTIGITCCLLIFQYVAFEKSYASNLTRPKSRAEKRISRYFADTGLVLVSTRPPRITFAISW